ncbi:MAG: heterodisulfide reductase-related iron-sulfur binding cluster [Ilumatobacteraceae bacterium]
MTTTYDPYHPQYLDEADVRNEMTRVYDLCHGCRLCFKFCTSFPSLFEMIDRHDDQDAGRLTPAQQDRVVDECFQCKLCYVNCPYTPGQHEWALDFPRLMLRADAMRHEAHLIGARDRATTAVLGHTDLVGKAATRLAPIANKVVAAPAGSTIRKVVAAVTGVSAERLLPPYARQRFSTWFKKRPKVRSANIQGRVAVVPTCLVEYQNPGVGHDLVKVYERNGIDCQLTDGVGCCGAPWLHSGDSKKFTEVARKNVVALAKAVRAGRTIVVPQPTCGYVLKQDYVSYAPGPDAELVAANTYDSSEYLMKVHKAEHTSLDTEFEGEIPTTITYHTPCHLKAQNAGLKSRDLLKLTGAKIKLAQQCSGIDGMWGLRAANERISISIGRKLADEIERAGSEVVVGDCHLANTAITEQTGAVARHPLQVLARAYGIPEEETR